MQPNDNDRFTPPDYQQPVRPQLSGMPTPQQPKSPWAQPQFQQTPSKKKRTKLIIAIVSIVVLLGGCSAAALAYYNNPSKVLGDMLTDAMSAKSAKLAISATIQDTKQSPEKVTISANGIAALGGNAQFNGKATVTDKGKSYDITGDFINADQTAYFRFTNLQKLFDSQADDVSKAFYGPIVQKIDNTWIAFDILEGLTETTDSTNACQNAIKAFQLSDDEKQALKKLYQQHPFITVNKQLGNETVNGAYSLHYLMSSSDKEAAQFQAEAMKLASIKKVSDACGISAGTQNATQPAEPVPHVEIWVDMWSHRLTKLLVSSQEDSTTTSISIEDTLNVPVDVQKPKDAKSLKNLLQDAWSSLYSAYPSSSFDTSSDLN